jgi:glycosyltransferase involved in cell wall biosynthesis
MNISNTKLAISFRRVGPYHHARLKAVATIIPNLLVIEGSGKDQIYAWDKVDTGESFNKTTLFPENDAHFVNYKELASKTEAVLNKNTIQAMLIHGWSEKGALAALVWCRKNRIPAVIMSESQAIDRPRTYLKEFIKRRVLTNFSSALCGGKTHADYLIDLGMSPNSIFTGYDVIDNDYFIKNAISVRKQIKNKQKQYNLPENYFLASGRFIEKKNFSRLLHAYANYRQQGAPTDWKLVLLGDGELRSELLTLIKQLNLEHHVLLPGFKQYQNLPIYYGLANTFIHCSTREQWGLVVNEAMASGLPVLVSQRCGCAAELVIEGENGFTFDPYDTKEMARLMIAMAGGKYNIDAMGKSSRNIIRKWTPEVFASNLKKSVEVALQTPVRKFGFFDRLILQMLTKLT